MNQAPARHDWRHRSRSRAWVLQIHYRWEAGRADGTLRDALAETLATRRVSPERIPYVRRVVERMQDHLDEIDVRLRQALDNWRLERLSSIDRGLLRLAATEMLYLDDVPPKVSIQEAIQLAEAYSGPEGPRFVNGVLDALYRTLDGSSPAARPE